MKIAIVERSSIDSSCLDPRRYMDLCWTCLWVRGDPDREYVCPHSRVSEPARILINQVDALYRTRRQITKRLKELKEKHGLDERWWSPEETQIE